MTASVQEALVQDVSPPCPRSSLAPAHCLTSHITSHTWLMCTADTWAEHTEEWLGELGKDLQGPMDSCCFFLVATIFWATSRQRQEIRMRGCWPRMR